MKCENEKDDENTINVTRKIPGEFLSAPEEVFACFFESFDASTISKNR